jgi:uncharacterized membrane protein YhaH (DUF805 family)
MIYKFIDKNGSEITVNSLSSLQALVDSETVKEDTKVKAGLRGKWTTASKIDELVFTQEIEEESVVPEKDIKSFIIEEKNNEEEFEKKAEEAPIQPWQNKNNKDIVKKELDVVEKNDDLDGDYKQETEEEQEQEQETEEEQEQEQETEQESNEEKSEYELEEEKIDKTYDDENVIGLNIFNSFGICMKKFFNFRDRASRSEYWYFQLIFAIISIPLFIYEDSFNDAHLIYSGVSGILVLILFIPALSVSVRRLHDINKSGWFVLISAIPFIGWIILAVMLIDKGTLGKNKFGKYPLKLKK